MFHFSLTKDTFLIYYMCEEKMLNPFCMGPSVEGALVFLLECLCTLLFYKKIVYNLIRLDDKYERI